METIEAKMKAKLIFIILLLFHYSVFAQEFEWAIEPKFRPPASFNVDDYSFKEGLAPACDMNNKWGFINKKGEWVYSPQFRHAYSFSEGLAGVRFDDDNVSYGSYDRYMDKNGKLVLSRYRRAFPFENGQARVETEDGGHYYIDKKGNVIKSSNTSSIHVSIPEVHEGLIYFTNEKEKYGYKDSVGNVIIPAKFDDAYDFSDGLARVKINNKWSFINKHGNLVFTLQIVCDEVGDFQYGAALVKQNDIYGYIDKTGKWIFKPQFQEVHDFKEGYAVVKKNGLFGYIDNTGKWIFSPQFEDASDFEEGYAVVKKNGLYGYIENTGEWIIHPQFINAKQFSEDLALVITTDKKAGFIKKPTFEIKIKSYVENKITEWQKKGEFEKSSDYKNRVNDGSRNEKIQFFTNEYIDKLKKKLAQNFDWNSLKLCDYDADNETYLIKSSQIGDFALPVSISDAQIFKQNWKTMKFTNADFSIKETKFNLAKLTITNPATGKKYIYDSKQPTVYAANNITYNFKPIEVNVPQENQKNNSSITQNNTIVGLSEVDINIPLNQQTSNITFAVIIANENYQKEEKVQFALNDGKVFKEYCEKTLGIPSKNIHFVQDATFGNMKSEIKWISDVISAYNGQAKVVFYYAGHGMPNEKDTSSYLLPVDGFSSDFETAIKLQDLYDRLAKSPAQNVTIFLDACFSGSKRDDGMLANARNTRRAPKGESLKGNLVVFSAASGNETAFPYKEKQHGLFTYYLLKKLQETKGNANFGELSNYIIENVMRQSVVVNQKSQTPQVNKSAELDDIWKTLKLK
jgi:hypothetical protein